MAAHRVAVVGCGHWGQNLVRCFRDLGALVAVCDRSPESRERAKRLAPDALEYESSARMFAEADISGAVIATPAETHAEMCEAALEANLDVLCEKPLALTYEDARRVATMATDRSRVLMVGHVLEYHPAVEKLRDLVHAGELGTLRYVYSNRLNLGKVRREENILWSFAPHDIAVILRLVGAMPCRVLASGGAYLQPNVADVTVTQLRFDSGVAAHVFVSWLNPFKEQQLVVVGSRKMATLDDVSKALIVHDQRVDFEDGQPISFKRDGVCVDYSAEEPLRRQCAAFLEAISTRAPPRTDSASALRVLRVLEAAQQSLVNEGQPVTLPDG